MRFLLNMNKLTQTTNNFVDSGSTDLYKMKVNQKKNYLRSSEGKISIFSFKL